MSAGRPLIRHNAVTNSDGRGSDGRKDTVVTGNADSRTFPTGQHSVAREPSVFTSTSTLPTALALADDEVHLWLLDSAESPDDQVLDDYRGLLSDDERAREPGFHFAKDRLRYVLTRVLIRTTLSRYAAPAPAAWHFRNNEYGRPEIVCTGEAGADSLRFNVSHTDGLIALAVTRRREVGVDTEQLRERGAVLPLAERFFSAEEASALRELPQEQQQQRFFEYWTLKEAYIKARGMGLSIPLEQFAFAIDASTALQLRIDTTLNDEPQRWRFWQFWAAPQYIAALCVEGHAREMLRVHVRQVRPLLGEHWRQCQSLRQSPGVTIIP